MTKQEWDSLKPSNLIAPISNNEKETLVVPSLDNEQILCIVTEDGFVPLSELNPDEWTLIKNDEFNISTRKGKELLKRSWAISSVDENSPEGKKGYTLMLMVQDDPKFIRFFKTNDDMWDVIEKMEEEFYSPKMQVIR